MLIRMINLELQLAPVFFVTMWEDLTLLSPPVRYYSFLQFLLNFRL